MYFKKLLLFLVLTLFLLFLAACGSNDNNDSGQATSESTNTNENVEVEEAAFSGESDSWEATLEAEKKGEKEKREFKLTYTGDDVDSIDGIDYDVDGSESFGKEDASLNIQDYIIDKETSKESAFATEDDEIDVTVEWNDETEDFQLEKDD